MAQTDKTTIPNGTEEQNASAQTVASPTNIIFENTSVQAINQVDGFDPQAYLLENEDGTKANCLGLQMTWFRLKYPDGKIDPEVVQLTPHGAIFKSTVYKSSEMMQDTFLARSYGSCNSNDAVVGHKYVEAAESIATSRALMRAGFGCQFFDQLGEFEVSQTTGVPESAEETDAEAPPPEVAKAGPADKGKKRAPAKRAAKGETPQVKKSESSNETPVAASGETPVPVTTNPEGEAEEQVEGQLSLNEPAPSAPAPAPAPAQTAPDPAPVAPAAPPAQPAQSQVSPPPVQQSAPAQAPPAPSAAAPVQGVAQPLGAVPVVAPPPAPAAPPAPPAPPAAPNLVVQPPAVAQPEAPVTQVAPPPPAPIQQPMASPTPPAQPQQPPVSVASPPQPTFEVSAETAAVIQKYQGMSCEDIQAAISLDEAKLAVIDVGDHAGKTLNDVAIQAPGDIEWFATQYRSDNNLLRAAAAHLLAAGRAQAGQVPLPEAV